MYRNRTFSVAAFFVFLFCLTLLVQSNAHARTSLSQLQQQINDLQAQVDALQGQVDNIPAGPQGGPALYVVDRNGDEVGLLIDNLIYSYKIFNETLGVILEVPPHTGIPTIAGLANLDFDSDDCTGTRVIWTNVAQINEIIVYSTMLGKYYRVVEVKQNYETHSELSPAYPNCYVRDAPISTVTIMEEYTGIIPTFPPPLHIEVR